MLGVKIYRRDKSTTTIQIEGSGLYYYSNFPKLYIKNNQVNIEMLDKLMLPVLTKLNLIAFKYGLNGFIITSGNDGIHGGSNGSNSLHFKNRAIDISFFEAIVRKRIPGINLKSSPIVKEILSSLNPKLNATEYDIVIEKDHIHIEYDPKGRFIVAPKEKMASESSYSFEREPIRYVHTNIKIKTLNQLLQSSLIFSKYKEDVNKLLNYKGKTSLSNREQIESLYEEGDVFDTLKLNTVLYLDPEMIDRDFAFKGTGRQIVDTSNFPMFYSKLRTEIEQNPNYIPSHFFKIGNQFPVEYINHLVSVWVYSKSLGKIIDITSLCSSVIVNSDTPISTFSLLCNITSDTNGDTIINTFQNNISFIERNLSINDIIFIRFEELVNEKSRGDRYEISFDELAGNIYDFMGFIGNITPELWFGKASGSVNVSGQCFSKLFTDDEAIFLPISTIKDSVSGNLIIGKFEGDRMLKRLFADGKYYSLFAVQYRTIQDSILFYMNQLSNTGLIPQEINDLIFRSYKDRREKLYKIKGDSLQTSLVDGVYQIINVIFDDAVKDRTVVDSTITNPSGSIMTLFNKICQYPLVEFLTDTYGDTYNIVIRKPPFDKKSILSFLEQDSPIYSLGLDDVASQNLSFEDKFYTWFQIENTGVFLGDSQSVSLTYIPIIPIPEYIEYWGSKKFHVQSNYTRSSSYGTNDEKKQVLLDLLYVVESSIYLPFSRKGTITLAKGDRRIKKGTWIRYNGEILYINSVSNEVSIKGNSISRRTTLSVSRGLVIDYIEGVVVDGVKMSYFDIINFQGLRETMEEFLTNDQSRGSVINRNVIVNKDIFKFFVNKRQIDE